MLLWLTAALKSSKSAPPDRWALLFVKLPLWIVMLSDATTVLDENSTPKLPALPALDVQLLNVSSVLLSASLDDVAPENFQSIAPPSDTDWLLLNVFIVLKKVLLFDALFTPRYTDPPSPLAPVAEHCVNVFDSSSTDDVAMLSPCVIPMPPYDAAVHTVHATFTIISERLVLVDTW